MQNNCKSHTTTTDSAIWSQTSLSGYENSIFETPPSLNKSPQFNPLTSAPLVSPVRTNFAVACCVCGIECGRGYGFQLNSCNHIYCNKCISLTISPNGRYCAMCLATATMALDSAYLPQALHPRTNQVTPSQSQNQFGDSLISQSPLMDPFFMMRLDSPDKDENYNFGLGSESNQRKAYSPLSDECQPVKLVQPDGTSLNIGITESSAGTITIAFNPKMDGTHYLHIHLHELNNKVSPIQLGTPVTRDYKEIANHGELFHFGKEGSGDGELCRPWGICCDRKGRIIVADRSNNRVQIFDCEGKFLQKFGVGGNKSGQFDRPAGVCTNSYNQIIVADKDNHRIQVFDEEGNYMFKFGERGRGQAMFNYPWGVTTNSLNEIAVSDTRNHRVQVFSENGEFLLKCGFDTAYFYKHLDSPRGVCYLTNGQLLITDFNNHRIVMIGSKGGSNMKCYGSEGDKEGLFLRPQGITVDADGHILVCDSRNNRVQVFTSEDMQCISVFGSANASSSPTANISSAAKERTRASSISGTIPLPIGAKTLDFSLPSPTNQIKGALKFSENPGSGVAQGFLDRPTDLCIGHDGRIYVVDFGNSCIRVF